ncbi:MAG: IS110 family transposase [Chthonomonadales bacterium]
MKAWIGIDVSKDSLDVWLIKEDEKSSYKQFKNESAGWSRMLRWLSSTNADDLHFCMESTGAHSTGLALFLAERGLRVSVENPARVKHFGIAKNMLNKTDKSDSKTIAMYCQSFSPNPWRMSAPEVRQLAAFMRRYDDLQGLLNQEKNRFAEPGLIKEVHRSLKQSVRFLEKQIEQLLDEIRRHIDRHPDLKEDQELLETIPGVGEITALWLLAELPDVSQFSTAQDAAVFAGLNPRENKSGTSLRGKTRLSKAGNRFLRKALYMPAMVAMRYNPLVKAMYVRLLERGLSKKSAIVACMRKLLMIAYGVLKNRCAFCTEHASTFGLEYRIAA